MANEKHLAILKQGVEVWNKWRKDNAGIVPVLSEVNLSKENLCGANLIWANLRGTNLTEANLSGANLSRANLNKANLRGANLAGANLAGANLNEANFSEVNLTEANMSQPDLKAAYLSDEAYRTRQEKKERNLSDFEKPPSLTSGYPISGRQDLLTKLLTKTKLSSQQSFKGVLLYTDEDKILKKYIKQYFQEFNKLSGDWCEIFILEKPSKEWRGKNLSLIERFNLKFLRQIDKSEAYDIAREFKIDINQIPCLILFGEKIYSQRLIIPIKQVSDLPKYFRELFTMLEKLLVNAANSTAVSLSGTSAFDTISYHFDQIINYLDKNAQEIVSEKQYLYQQKIIITQKLVMEDKSVSKNYNLQNSQIAGGIINAETINSHHIGGDIYNTDNLEHPD
jgi:Pentapeptide repeats (8 copies)